MKNLKVVLERDNNFEADLGKENKEKDEQVDKNNSIEEQLQRKTNILTYSNNTISEPKIKSPLSLILLFLR